jgi:hypothetical protein
MRGEAELLLRSFRAKERPEHLLRNLEEMRREGQVPDDVYGPLRQEYLDAIASADNELDKLRHGLRNRLSGTQDELSQKRQELDRVGNRYKYGDLARVQYERSARALESTIASLHDRAAWLHALSDATSAAEVESLAATSPGPFQASRSTAKGAAAEQSGHRRLLTAAAVLAVVLAIATVTWRALPPMRDLLPLPAQTSYQAVEMVTGDRVDVARQQLGASGGTVSVTGTGTPLDGLSVELPQGAYDAPVTFDFGYSAIEELDAGEGVQAISPLLYVDPDTEEYAEDLIALKIPVEVPEGHIAMAFVYDEDLGVLHPLPTLEESDGELTALSRHFCPFVILSTPRERLLPAETDKSREPPSNLESVKYATGFMPGRDTWNLFNAGSSVAPGGYCKGMSLTSLYYYLVERRITGQSLWRDEYDNGLPEGMGTPGFWQDDRWAIELCSAANELGVTSEAGEVISGVFARVDRLTPQRLTREKERQFYMTAFALYVTKSPQLLSTRAGNSRDGHSLLCYGIDGRTLLIADPNYPNKTDATMPFRNGVLGPYVSAQSTMEILAGNFMTYDTCYFVGDISFFNLGKLQTLWTNYEAGSLNAGFPPYTIRATELDDQGAPLGTYGLNPDIDNRAEARRVRFELDAAFDSRMTVYTYGSPPTALSGNEVTLDEGDNYIGFFVEEKVFDEITQKSRWEWAGFDWVSIYRPGEQQDAAVTGPDASFNYCSIKVDFDGVFIDKVTGEERHMRDSVGISAYGSFSGGTFTSTWGKTYEPAPPLKYCTGVSGHITVSIDPETLAVTGFDFEDKTTYTCNGLLRYTASGSGPKRYAGGLDEEWLFCSGRTDEGMPPPSITWEENEPEPGEDCGGYRTYQLISAENFSVLIQLMEKDPDPEALGS